MKPFTWRLRNLTRYVALACIIAACGADADAVRPAGADTSVGVEVAEEQARLALLQSINDARAAAQVPPVQLSDELSAAAEERARSLPGRLTPTPGTDDTVSVDLERVTETAGFATDVDGVVELLVHDPRHHDVVLDGRFTELGIGVAVVGGYVYVSQLYGAR